MLFFCAAYSNAIDPCCCTYSCYRPVGTPTCGSTSTCSRTRTGGSTPTGGTLKQRGSSPSPASHVAALPAVQEASAVKRVFPEEAVGQLCARPARGASPCLKLPACRCTATCRCTAACRLHRQYSTVQCTALIADPFMASISVPLVHCSRHCDNNSHQRPHPRSIPCMVHCIMFVRPLQQPWLHPVRVVSMAAPWLLLHYAHSLTYGLVPCRILLLVPCVKPLSGRLPRPHHGRHGAH